MAITISSRGSIAGRLTQIFEFFDPRILAHLWFVALSDGDAVQLLAPTFHSERAARIFERCVVESPSSVLLSIDGQFELAHRIERELEDSGEDPSCETLLSGLPLERPLASSLGPA